jgi:hypothetical protein
MANFSPALMAQFRSETLNVSIGPDRSSKSSPTKVYHWTGTHAQFFEFRRQCAADNSTAGETVKHFSKRLSATDSWAALFQEPAEFFATGVSTKALKTFKEAQAKMHADTFIPSDPIRTVSGPQWIIPEVLAGTATCGRRRERRKLPPLNLDLGITAMARTDWTAITNSLAPLAHALWGYTLAGGVVNLTVHHCWAFSRKNDGHAGVVFSIKPPLTSMAAFATACSVQALRGGCLVFGQGLTGVAPGHDGMPLMYWKRPGLHMLNGISKEDAAIIKALNVA